MKYELPKVAYLISNILVYVDRQPMHNKSYVHRIKKTTLNSKMPRYQERVLDFSKRAAPGLNSSDRPHLVIVQNFCPDNDPDEYDIATSTREFRKLLEASGELQRVDDNFASLSFIKIPDAAKDQELFSEQIYHLQVPQTAHSVCT